MSLWVFNKNAFSLFKEYFGVITFVTLALGYIGFYTYSARYSLPFVYPDLSQVAAIGILSLLVLGCFFLVSGGKLKRRATAVQALIFYLLAGVLINRLNPILLFLAVYANIDNFDSLFNSSRNISFATKRKKLKSLFRRNFFWTIIINSAFVSMGIFLSMNVLITWIFVDSSVGILKRIRLRRIELHKIVILTILTPIFLFGFFIDDFDFSLFGLSRVDVTVIKKNGEVTSGKLIYKDNSMFYFEDKNILKATKNRWYFTPPIKGSYGISVAEIVQFKVDSISDSKIGRRSFIDILNE